MMESCGAHWFHPRTLSTALSPACRVSLAGPPDSKRSGAGSVRLDDTSPSVPEPSGGPGPARLLSPILASTANIRSKYIHRHLARSRMQHAQWADVLGSVAAGVAPSKKSIVDEPIKEETEGSEVTIG